MNPIRSLMAAIAAILLIASGVLALTGPASAVDDEPCVPTPGSPAIPGHPATPAVPGTPEVPAVPGTPEVPAVTETIPATPDLWWNWSPNDTKGPQDYEPAFPVDARGTWQGPHANGGPDQDTYGTFNASNGNSGNSSWFHREHGTREHTVVITPAIPATPGTPAIPGTPGRPEVPATPDIPAVPPVECPPVEPPVDECPGGDFNGDNPGCIDPPVECPDGDLNGDLPGCDAVEPPVDTCETDPTLCPVPPVEPPVVTPPPVKPPTSAPPKGHPHTPAAPTAPEAPTAHRSPSSPAAVPTTIDAGL